MDAEGDWESLADSGAILPAFNETTNESPPVDEPSETDWLQPSDSSFGATAPTTTASATTASAAASPPHRSSSSSKESTEEATTKAHIHDDAVVLVSLDRLLGYRVPVAATAQYARQLRRDLLLEDQGTVHAPSLLPSDKLRHFVRKTGELFESGAAIHATKNAGPVFADDLLDDLGIPKDDSWGAEQSAPPPASPHKDAFPVAPGRDAAATISAAAAARGIPQLALPRTLDATTRGKELAPPSPPPPPYRGGAWITLPYPNVSMVSLVPPREPREGEGETSGETSGEGARPGDDEGNGYDDDDDTPQALWRQLCRCSSSGRRVSDRGGVGTAKPKSPYRSVRALQKMLRVCSQPLPWKVAMNEELVKLGDAVGEAMYVARARDWQGQREARIEQLDEVRDFFLEKKEQFEAKLDDVMVRQDARDEAEGASFFGRNAFGDASKRGGGGHSEGSGRPRDDELLLEETRARQMIAMLDEKLDGVDDLYNRLLDEDEEEEAAAEDTKGEATVSRREDADDEKSTAGRIDARDEGGDPAVAAPSPHDTEQERGSMSAGEVRGHASCPSGGGGGSPNPTGSTAEAAGGGATGAKGQQQRRAVSLRPAGSAAAKPHDRGASGGAGAGGSSYRSSATTAATDELNDTAGGNDNEGDDPAAAKNKKLALASDGRGSAALGAAAPAVGDEQLAADLRLELLDAILAMVVGRLARRPTISEATHYSMLGAIHVSTRKNWYVPL